MEAIVQNHREVMTFEDFASQVFSPSPGYPMSGTGETKTNYTYGLYLLASYKPPMLISVLFQNVTFHPPVSDNLTSTLHMLKKHNLGNIFIFELSFVKQMRLVWV